MIILQHQDLGKKVCAYIWKFLDILWALQKQKQPVHNAGHTIMLMNKGTT